MVVSAVAGLFISALLQSGVPGNTLPPTRLPDIVGTINTIYAFDGSVFILVEALSGRLGARPFSGWVRVTKRTTILKQEGDTSAEQAKIDDLEKNSLVKVWFTGNVLQTYPCQAKAAFVLVVSSD